MGPRVRSAVAPALLVIIACLQLTLAHTRSLTPWKGGGFGMFSTVDSRDARFVRLFVKTADGEFPVATPPNAREAVSRARSLPTREQLETVAREVARSAWSRADARSRSRLRPKQKIDPPDSVVPAQAVRAEMWRYVFDAGSGRLNATRTDQVVLTRKTAS
jgi:hypothetical protein